MCQKVVNLNVILNFFLKNFCVCYTKSRGNVPWKGGYLAKDRVFYCFNFLILIITWENQVFLQSCLRNSIFFVNYNIKEYKILYYFHIYNFYFHSIVSAGSIVSYQHIVSIVFNISRNIQKTIFSIYSENRMCILKIKLSCVPNYWAFSLPSLEQYISHFKVIFTILSVKTRRLMNCSQVIH